MSLNDHQKDYMKSLSKVPPEELCDCGWYRVNECSCSDQKKYADARSSANRLLTRLRKAGAEIERLTAEIQQKDTALRQILEATKEAVSIDSALIEVKRIARKATASDRRGHCSKVCLEYDEPCEQCPDPSWATVADNQPTYRACLRCNGEGVARENDEDIDCPDCEGEGEVDQQGFPRSYATAATSQERDAD